MSNKENGKTDKEMRVILIIAIIIIGFILGAGIWQVNYNHPRTEINKEINRLEILIEHDRQNSLDAITKGDYETAIKYETNVTELENQKLIEEEKLNNLHIL